MPLIYLTYEEIEVIQDLIEALGWIKRENAVNEVEIDIDKLKALPIDRSGFVDCELRSLILDIKHLNPLKLKQQKEGKK